MQATVEPLDDAFCARLDTDGGEELRQGRGTLSGPALNFRFSKKETVCVCSSDSSSFDSSFAPSPSFTLLLTFHHSSFLNTPPFWLFLGLFF